MVILELDNTRYVLIGLRKYLDYFKDFNYLIYLGILMATLQKILKTIEPNRLFRRRAWINSFSLYKSSVNDKLKINRTNELANSDMGLHITDLLANDWYILERADKNKLKDGQTVTDTHKNYLYYNGSFHEYKTVILDDPIYLT